MDSISYLCKSIGCYQSSIPTTDVVEHARAIANHGKLLDYINNPCLNRNPVHNTYIMPSVTRGLFSGTCQAYNTSKNGMTAHTY